MKISKIAALVLIRVVVVMMSTVSAEWRKEKMLAKVGQ